MVFYDESIGFELTTPFHEFAHLTTPLHHFVAPNSLPLLQNIIPDNLFLPCPGFFLSFHTEKLKYAEDSSESSHSARDQVFHIRALKNIIYFNFVNML